MEAHPSLDPELVRAAPKVLLHEHLDGGLRPTTVLELAAEVGYDELPESDPEALGRWFHAGADRGSLPEYLEGFRHTIAVMQKAGKRSPRQNPRAATTSDRRPVKATPARNPPQPSPA
jgi:adenosine deaminase